MKNNSCAQVKYTCILIKR